MSADAVGYRELISDSPFEYLQKTFIDRDFKLFVPTS